MTASRLTPAEPETPEQPGVRAIELGHHDDRLEPEAAHRRFGAWDVAGILVFAWMMLAINRLGVVAMGTPLGRSSRVDAVTVAVMTTAVGCLALLVVWERPAPGLLIRWLTAIWREPPMPSVSFLFGAILAVPLFGLYYPDLFDDADSERLVASIRYVEQGHLRYLADTQDPILPHVVLTPFMAVAGMTGLKLATMLSVLVLAGVVTYVTFRITGAMWSAGAAAVGLLCITSVYDRAFRLPMYPAMLSLGYLGAWLAYRALSEPDSRWRYAIPGGFCLALAQEAHGVGQLFLAVPLLVAVFASQVRPGLLQLLRVGVGMASVLIPRFIINYSVGGLAFITSSRTDYWITKGYVEEIQVGFWDYQGVNEGVFEYLSRLPGRFAVSLGSQAWVVLVCASLAWVACCRGRARWFVLAVSAFFVIAITVKPVPGFGRYYSPAWPGIAILTGVLMAALLRDRRSRRGTLALRGISAGLSSILLVAATLSYRDAVAAGDIMRSETEFHPYAEMAAAINDGKGVIGARSVLLLATTTDLATWGNQFLSEEEYVTYLTWPSDEAVIAMMNRHNIGWVLIHRLAPLETSYNNTWLDRHYNLGARHPTALAASPNFCRYMAEGGFVLYKLGPCPDVHPG